MSISFAEFIFGTPGTMRLCMLFVFGGLLIGASWSDLRYRKIPNRLVFPGAVLGLLLHMILPAGDGFFSDLPGGLGGLKACEGLAYGLLSMLPLYLWLGFGAGDVKLMAMVGAFLGPVQVWPALLSSLMAGGVLALFILFSRDALGLRMAYLRALFLSVFQKYVQQRPEQTSTVASTRLPYALAIAIGSSGYLAFQSSLFRIL